MQTGMISTFAGKIMDIGPMYPFVGTEVALVVISVMAWIAWHICQTKAETKEMEEIMKMAKDKKVQMRHIHRDSKK